MIEKDVPLSEFTTIKIGGRASLFFAPQSLSDIKLLKTFAGKFPIFVLGGGSNTVFGNFKGLVLYTGNLRGFKVLKNTGGEVEIIALSGTPLKELLPVVIKENLTGLEGLFGIPGITVGGAVAMNAGAYGFETSKVVSKVLYYDLKDFSLKVEETPPFGYRSSPFLDKTFVVAVRIKLKRCKKNVLETLRELNRRRTKSQPLHLPTAGSTFKNPEGLKVWKLLDDVGLRGFCIGGVCFSKKHANFAVNIGGATFGDFKKLLGTAKERVFKAFGIELEEEVKVVGN